MKYGKRSRIQIDTLHEDAQTILDLFITRTSVDISIIEGHRTKERQFELFQQGKSKIDGYIRKGKHNYWPSLAWDIIVYHRLKKWRSLVAYDPVHLAYVAGLMESCAKELYEQGHIEHLVRWGGNWDRDGVLLLDQDFDDLVHFELYKPR